MKRTLLIISTIISIGASAQIPTTGMIAGYTFDGNANDASGNGHNGIVNGATLTSNRLGVPNAAYYFNGTSNYIRVPSTAALTPVNMTICAEVMPKGFYSGNCQGNTVISKGRENTNAFYTLIFSDNPYDNGSCSNFDSLHDVFDGVFGYNPTTQASHLYTPYIQSNTWYCAITTFDGSTIKVYIDGTLKSSYTATNAMVGDTNSLYIGAYGYDLVQFPYWFKGVVDDVHLYNRVLTQNEINGYCSVLAGIDSPGSIASHVTINTLSGNMYELVFDKNYRKVQVNISSVLGQTVFTSEKENSGGSMLKLSSFANGIYILNIVTEDGIFSTKLIKN